MENRSFDNLFGEFPGANGLAQAGEAAIQRDRDGKPFDGAAGRQGAVRQAARTRPSRGHSEPGRPAEQAVPTVGVRPASRPPPHTRDLIHAFYTNRSQIHGGKNDLFAACSRTPRARR